MTISDGAICVGCLNIVVAMDTQTFKKLCQSLGNNQVRMLGEVKVWTVFCRRHAPRYVDPEGYDYEKIFINRDMVLQSAAWERAKRFMSPTLANPVSNGVVEVMASSVYPLGITTKMTRLSMDLNSDTPELSVDPPPEFM